MQIAASNPLAIGKDDTMNIMPLRLEGDGHSEDNTSLLPQSFIKAPSITVAKKIHLVARQDE